MSAKMMLASRCWGASCPADELLGHLRRDIGAENSLDTGSLGLGGCMSPDHVACAMNGQRRDARHQCKHYPLVHAEGNAEKIRIEHNREIIFARKRPLLQISEV